MINRVVRDSAGRSRVLRYHPEWLAEDYESPRTNLQRVLQQIVATQGELLRRET